VVPSELAQGHPTRVGRYEVISHLATGGMAQIYLARQSGLAAFERHVVLKTILRERASDERFVTMFLDEAKLAATLNHQNVAQVYEVDQVDGTYFMAMEYVHGENARAILETAIRRGWTIPLELSMMIVSGAAAGLHHAHERRGKNGLPLNIVHRDVSPANIMVGFDGSVKVLDFGIAKAEERATKTVGGTIKGKYGYMSPEQCKGKPLDRRSDIFALGICLYEMTTLRRAFKGNDDFETMKRIVSGDVMLPSVAVPKYPRELEAIVLTAMANDSNARFQTAQEMIEALDAFAQRAKLVGSNTAMGRFMGQLFGSKKEPWVAGADQHSERTAVSGEPAEEEEKTTLMSDGAPVPQVDSRVTTAPIVPQPAAELVARIEPERRARPASTMPDHLGADLEIGNDTLTGTPPPRTISRPPVMPAGRLGSSDSGIPLPPTSASADRPSTDSGAHPVPGIFGAHPVPRPVVRKDDLASSQLPDDIRVTSSRSWIVFAILLVLCIAAGVAIALTTGQ
jgi:serine/threonine-protein kinase